MTARPIEASELLELAGVLAGREAGRGRPRTILLRRAVSSAYYALFHHLSRHAADELFTGHSPSPTLWNAAARWLSHGDVRELAEAVQGGGKSAVRAMFPKPPPDLVALAGAFSALQDARHEADYNHDYDIGRPAALSLVHQASAAVGTADRMRAVGDPSYLLFLRLMVGSVKIAESR